jgi:hypothetical protein
MSNTTATTGTHISIADIGTFTSPSGRPRRGRVDAFYRFADIVQHKNSDLDAIFAEIKAEEEANDPELAVRRKNQIYLQACSQEQAQFLGLSSTCGAIIPLSGFTRDGQAKWSREEIEAANAQYILRLSDTHRLQPFAIQNHWKLSQG